MIFISMSALSYDERDLIEEIFNKYYPFIKHTIFKLTNNSNIVLDLSNDVLEKLIKKVTTLSKLNEKQITLYVYQTARNTAINFIVKDQKARSVQLYGVEDDISTWVPDSTSLTLEESIETKLEYNETMERVKALPEKDRNLFLFRYLYGMSDKEIAKELDIKPAYVRVYISRVRKKLFEKETAKQ